MVTVEITNQIKMRSSDLPEPQMKRIKTELTLDNPRYFQALKYDQSIHGISRTIILYRDANDFIILPRGSGRRLFELLKEHNIRFEISDQCVRWSG